MFCCAVPYRAARVSWPYFLLFLPFLVSSKWDFRCKWMVGTVPPNECCVVVSNVNARTCCVLACTHIIHHCHVCCHGQMMCTGKCYTLYPSGLKFHERTEQLPYYLYRSIVGLQMLSPSRSMYTLKLRGTRQRVREILLYNNMKLKHT